MVMSTKLQEPKKIRPVAFQFSSALKTGMKKATAQVALRLAGRGGRNQRRVTLRMVTNSSAAVG